MEWISQGSCLGKDPNIFFPLSGESHAPAKAICRTCPVKFDCRDRAIEQNETQGIWGGMNRRDRRKYVLGLVTT